MKIKQIILRLTLFIVCLLLFFAAVILTEYISVVSRSKYQDYWTSPSFVKEGAYYVSVNPNMVRSRFKADKPAGEYRVFVIGSSQAMGSPYVQHNYDKTIVLFGFIRMPNTGGISTWLEQYLRVILPGKEIKVVNVCQDYLGIEAHLKVFKEVAALGKPDLVIILAGNNERDSPAKYGAIKLYNPSRHDMEIISRNLDDIVGHNTRNYALAAGEIVSLAGEKGLKVYFATVPSNLRDWIPVDLPLAGRSRIEDLIGSGKYKAALALLRGGGPDNNSVRSFYTAKCYDKMGMFSEAKEYYYKAREQDKSFMRVRGAWNGVIRALSGGSVRVIDLERIISSYAKDGIPGEDLFHDHCHFKLRANMLAAREFAKFYIRDNGLPETEVAKIEALRLEYNGRDDLRLLYLIKFLKWTKLEIYAFLTGQYTGSLGQMRDSYARSLKELHTINTLIFCDEADLRGSYPGEARRDR